MNPLNKKKSIALALSISLAVVVSGAYVAQAETTQSLASQAGLTASEVVLGFNATFGDIPARIAERISGSKINARAKSESAIAYVAPDVSKIRIAVEKMFVSSTTPKSFAQKAPKISNNVSAIDFFTSSYVALGENIYSAIASMLSGYSSIIEKSGTRTLALAAVVASEFSIGERVAMTTYESVRSFFGSASQAISNFFAPSPSVAPPAEVDATKPPEQPVAPPPVVREIQQPQTTRTQQQTTNSYPTYTTVIQGVSPDFMEKSLASLRTELLSSISNSIRPVATQTVTNAATIQSVARIEDLSNLIVRNGDFRGGSLTSASSISATSGSFTSLSSGATTITGDLSVSGTFSPATITSSDYISAPYFVATSTTATSTFAAGIQSTYLNITGTSATSTFARGIDLAGGCFSINGTCVGGGGGGASLTVANTWTALQQFQANASTTAFSAYDNAYFGATATSTFNSAGVLTLSSALAVTSGGTGQTSFGQGWLHSDGTTFTSSTSPTVNYIIATSTTATSTFAAGIQSTYLNITGTSATSTFARGIDLAGGCFSINGTCVGGSGSSASTTLLADVNTWTGLQQFTNASTTQFSISGSSWLGTPLALVGTNITGTGASFTAGSATVLATGRNINGTSFNGSADITIAAASSTLLGDTNSWSGSNVFTNAPTLGSLSGLLYGASGVVTAVTGTAGQFSYFNGTNTLTATSSIYLATTQNVGVGTTTPLSNLSISGSASIGADYNFAAPTNGLIVQGSLGVGTTSPWLALSVTNTSTSGQFVASYDDSNYATLAVDAVGDLKITAKGGDIRALSENLWVCDNAGCPTLTATSTAGNVFIENAITFGNGFSMASTSNVAASELGLYNASGQIIVIFDDGL